MNLNNSFPYDMKKISGRVNMCQLIFDRLLNP